MLITNKRFVRILDFYIKMFERITHRIIYNKNGRGEVSFEKQTFVSPEDTPWVVKILMIWFENITFEHLNIVKNSKNQNFNKFIRHLTKEKLGVNTLCMNHTLYIIIILYNIIYVCVSQRSTIAFRNVLPAEMGFFFVRSERKTDARNRLTRISFIFHAMFFTRDDYIRRGRDARKTFGTVAAGIVLLY